MINDQSHGLWRKTAQPTPPTQTLAQDIAVDVAIVGGGYTGLSTALHLAERGVNAIVLEATEIGAGAAGRATGMVNAGLWVMPSAIKAQLGPQFGSRMVDLLGTSPDIVFDIIAKHDMQCEARRAGTLHCAVGKTGIAEIRERARQWQELGAPVQILDASETRSRTGAETFDLSMLDLRAGTVQPLSYVRGLAAAAIARGTGVFTGSPVRSITRDKGAWSLRTDGGKVLARSVLVATDVYTTGIVPELRGEQVVLPFFHVATSPLTPDQRRAILPGGHGAWDTRTPMTAFRTDAEGRLIIGSVGTLDGAGMAIHRAWALRRIRRLFPELEKIEIEHAWYGRIGMTSDHLPRLHAMGENLIALTGFNGRGIAPGTLFGRELARYLSGELGVDDMFLPFSTLQNTPLRALKEGYYRLGAALAHLPPSN